MRILLFHGFTGGKGSFAHLGIDAIAPDLPGHGDALDAPGWDDAISSLEPLLEPGPVVLGGYSMGARLALALALRRPQRIARLVLASATAGIEDASERAARVRDDEDLARMLENEGLQAFLSVWEQHPTLASLRELPAPLRSAMAAERLRHRPAGLASALRHLGAGAMPSLWGRLADLAVPVAVLAGARDAKFAQLACRLAARLPRASLQLIPDCGHAPHLETPAVFSAALTRVEAVR